MNGWVKASLLVGAFAMTIYVTSYVSRLPESNCDTAPVTHIWSSDHKYEATLLRKDCNRGETLFYSVRIDKPDPNPLGGWFLIEDIQTDPYPNISALPVMKWTAHRLEIEIAAHALSGEFDRREGDLTVTRRYVSAPSH
jgi:hypothetical protein